MRHRHVSALVAVAAAGCLLPVVSAAADGASRDPLFERWESFGPGQGLPSGRVLAVALDGRSAWAGTDRGLARVGPDGIRIVDEASGLPSRIVTALAVDPASGDVWAGTTAGLARVSAGRVDTYNQLDSGLANDVVYGVAVDDGDVWVATAAGLSHLDVSTGAWEIFDTSNTLMHEPWCYAVTASEGTVYVAVWGGGVIVRDPRSGRFRAHRDPDGEMEIDLFRDDGLVHDVTSGVAVSGGVLWVGTYFGLSRYDGKRWRSYNQEDSGLAGDFINNLAARGDAVWIGTDQGLSRFDSETWHTWRRSAGGTLLEIRTASGAVRELSVGGGPASDTIFGVAAGEDGVWVATAAGLSHGIPNPEPSRAGEAAHPQGRRE